MSPSSQAGADASNSADDVADGGSAAARRQDAAGAADDQVPSTPPSASGGAANSTGAAGGGGAGAAGADSPEPAQDTAAGAADGGSQSLCPSGVEPTEETCDGTDEDCDGMVDEALEQACGSSAISPCNLGVQICIAGTWGVCEGAVEPAEEQCDAQQIDENCNGTANEGCACAAGETMECGSDEGSCQKGTQTCTAEGKFSMTCDGAVEPKREVCDGKADDDCDGMPDSEDSDCECVDGEEEPCRASGIGLCAMGRKTCSGGKWAARCVPMMTGCVCDDDATPRACGSDTGACERGTQACVRGQWADECRGGRGPATERCDGVDSDCDGVDDASDDDVSCPTGQMCAGDSCIATGGGQSGSGAGSGGSGGSEPPATNRGEYASCTGAANSCASDLQCQDFDGVGMCVGGKSKSLTCATYYDAFCVLDCANSTCPSDMTCITNPFIDAAPMLPREATRFCIPVR